MKKLIGANILALVAIYALFALMPLLLDSCSNPSSTPGTSGITATNYSASAFFGTESYGDTSGKPFPLCFPAQYLQLQLGLSDSQVVAVQNLQDSLRAALQARIMEMKSAGTLTPDSVQAIRLAYETDLYTGVAAILTPAQFTALQSLVPPNPWKHFGRGPLQPFLHGNDSDMNGSAQAHWTPVQLDSIALAQLEAVLARAGDTATAAQITQIQNLQATLLADTTLTPQGRHDEFIAQLQTILTPAQLSALRRSWDFADRRWHR